MTEKQIDTFTKVQSAADKLSEYFDPSTFVLRPEAAVYIKEIQELQSKCDHEFVNGVCIVCNIKESEVQK